MMGVIGVISLIGTIVGIAAKVTTAAALAEAVQAGESLFDGTAVSAMNRFDYGFTKLVTSASTLLINIYDYAKYIVIIAFFLSLIFYAFKLLLGTIEIKKVFAENIYKIVIVIIAMNTFPTIVSNVYSMATHLGVEVSGGEVELTKVMKSLCNQTQSITAVSKKLKDLLSKGMNNNNYRPYDIDEMVLDAFIARGVSRDEALQWAKDNNIGVITEDSSVSMSYEYRHYMTQEKKGETYTLADFDNDEAEYNRFIRNKQAYEAVAALTDDTFKQQIDMVRKLSEILTGYSALDLDELPDELKDTAPTFNNLLSNSSDVIDHLFSNYYINGTNTLSAGSMMYIAVIVSELISTGTLSHLDEQAMNSNEPNTTWASLVDNQNKNLLIRFASYILKSFVYKYGIVFAMIFVLCEYYLTIIEYIIVTSLSVLVIPLFFIDATKNFASNVLKMLISYFFKILVSAFMCFFVMTYFITCCTEMIGVTDFTSTSNFLYYLFVLILGITLSKSSGKIAGAVISGNPTMGLGDLANEFRSMTGAFRTAGHEIQKGLHGLGAASQAAGKELGGAAEIGKGAGDVKALARQNALDSFDAARKENPDFGMSDKDTNRAARKMGREEARAYWGQALKNRGYKALHGGQSDAGLLQKGEDGKYSVASKTSGYAISGKKHYDGSQWLDYTGSTAVQANEKILQERTKDKLDKIIRENSGKALTTDDFKGSKTEGRPDLPSESGREA